MIPIIETMVRLSVLLILLLQTSHGLGYLGGRSVASARIRRPFCNLGAHRRKQRFSSSPQRSPTSRHNPDTFRHLPLKALPSALALRAGATTTAIPVTGNLSLLSGVAVALVGLNGLLMLASPGALDGIFGIQVKEGTIGRYIQQSNGAILLGQSIGLFLTLFTKLSPIKAIGLSLLPRLLYFTFFCVKANLSKNLMAGNFLSINTLTMAWAIFSMTVGVGRPTWAASVFCTMALFKATYLLTLPAKATKKYLGRDLTGKLLGNRTTGALLFCWLITFRCNL